ncbi:MAG: hypothetical protein LBF64_03635 [Oscillospiraceae bacterium]|jgi:hypothetical protein|nr:hypothetical protein [Oscillospiraceae bacterium]
MARHSYVASLPQVRKEYKLWQIEQVVTAEENARIFAKGRDEGRTEGRRAAQMEIALNAFRQARPDATQVIETLRTFGVSDEAIEAAQKQVESERAGALREQKRSEPKQ